MNDMEINNSGVTSSILELKDKIIDVYGDNTLSSLETGDLMQIIYDFADRGVVFEIGESGICLHDVFNFLNGK